MKSIKVYYKDRNDGSTIVSATTTSGSTTIESDDWNTITQVLRLRNIFIGDVLVWDQGTWDNNTWG